MNIKVGDRVKFLNDVGAGEVTRIIDKKTALVQIDGGFEVPSLIRDLVLEKGSYSDEEIEVPIQKNPQSFAPVTNKSENSETLIDEELLLAFLPSEDTSSFETYIINSSTYHFKFTIARLSSDEMVLYSQGDIEPGLKMILGNYSPGNMQDEEQFRVQGIFYNEGFYNHLPPVDMQFRLLVADLYNANSREESDYFLRPAVLQTLHSWREKEAAPEIHIDPEELKNALFSKGDIPKTSDKKKSNITEEVDLHIGQLAEDYSKMDTGEILDLQLSTFRTRLDSAVLHKVRRIVFIHGVGNGKLKHEIRRILDTDYRQLKYQDASFKEYGYGATMVII